MRTIIKISFLLIALISFSCSKSDNDTPVPNQSSKKVVEVKINYGSNYADYAANLGLQVASVDASLKNDFKFVGINSTLSIFHEASIIHQANLSPIPSATSSIKTSAAVSTFTISSVFTNLKENANPLTVTYEFYIDGKKTTTKTLVFQPNDYAAKSLILDVKNPTQIIAN